MSTSEQDEESPLLEGEKRHKILCCLHLTDRQISTAKTCCGYLLVVNAGVLFTLANVIQKYVAPELDFWHLLAYRALAQIVVMFADLQYKNVNWRGPEGHRKRISTQGMMGGILLLSIFIAIKHIPLGNASAIFFCTPVFTFLFAVTMLKEHMGVYRIIISTLMISGVLLITRPPFLFAADPISDDSGAHSASKDRWMVPLGYACAVAVPLLSAVVSIMTRQLKELRPSVIMLWFGIGSLVVSFGGIVGFQAGGFFDYTKLQFFYIAAITALGMVGNISYTFAVRWVSPSKGNVFRSFEVILNYVLQLVLEHSVFHISSVAGITLLLAAVAFTGFENEVMEKYSRKYKFL